jgi:hypothetical protein
VITNAWRPYRWRAYAVGVIAGVFAAGIVAPIVTASAELLLALAGVPIATTVPVWELIWSLVFVVTVPVVGARVFARWQPEPLRGAAQSYLWLALRAEANWATRFGTQPVPRDEQTTRSFLASVPSTPETAGERYGLWVGVLELDRAREAIAQMPAGTPHDGFNRASALWLVDFVGGVTHPIEPLDDMARQINDPTDRLEAFVTIAVNRARAALADGRDWRLPLAAARASLDAEIDLTYEQFVSRPTFRTLLASTAVGVVVFWAAVFVLRR